MSMCAVWETKITLAVGGQQLRITWNKLYQKAHEPPLAAHAFLATQRGLGRKGSLSLLKWEQMSSHSNQCMLYWIWLHGWIMR